MKSLIKKLLRESLLDEAIKTDHLEDESYIIRISNEINKMDRPKFREYPELKGKPFNDMPDRFRPVIDDRLEFIESLEFKVNDTMDIGVWTFDSPVDIKHWPYRRIDKGRKLIVIIGDNKLKTLFWTHTPKTKEPSHKVTVEELKEFIETDFYKGKKKPISIANLKAWKNGEDPNKLKQPNPGKFKKITLKDGTKIKHYINPNKFQSMDDKELNIDDIFDLLPKDLQDKVFDLLENKKK